MAEGVILFIACDTNTRPAAKLSKTRVCGTYNQSRQGSGLGFGRFQIKVVNVPYSIEGLGILGGAKTANAVRVRQSGPGSGLDTQAKVCKPFCFLSSSLKND